MNGTYEEVVKFIAAVAECTPKLSWRRLDIRPDFRRRHMRTNNTNLAAARVQAVQDQNAVNVMFNGVIRVIGYDGSQNIAALKKETKNAKTKGAVKK